MYKKGVLLLLLLITLLLSACDSSLSEITGKYVSVSGTLQPKVMIIIHNPVLESQGNMTLIEYRNWNDVTTLTNSFIQNIHDSSGGYVAYQIVESHEVDDIPIKDDGFDYTDESYLNCLANQANCHMPDGVDYHQILDDFDVCTKLNNNEIDELWVFGGPWYGFYESRLAGPDGFWYNSPPLTGTSCNRLLPIMGFNFERYNAEMLESFGHDV